MLQDKEEARRNMQAMAKLLKHLDNASYFSESIAPGNELARLALNNCINRSGSKRGLPT